MTAFYGMVIQLCLKVWNTRKTKRRKLAGALFIRKSSNVRGKKESRMIEFGTL